MEAKLFCWLSCRSIAKDAESPWADVQKLHLHAMDNVNQVSGPLTSPPPLPPPPLPGGCTKLQKLHLQAMCNVSNL